MALEAQVDRKPVVKHSEPPSAEEAEAALPEVRIVRCSDYRCQRWPNAAGREFCNDYPRATSYHYHNANGSFYQKLANGYSYYNDGKGYNRIELDGVFVREYRTEDLFREGTAETDEISAAPSTPPRIKTDPYPTPPPTEAQALRNVKAEVEDAENGLRSSSSPPPSPSPAGRIARPKLEPSRAGRIPPAPEQVAGPSSATMESASKAVAKGRRRSRSPCAAEAEDTGPSQRARLAFSTPEPSPAPGAAAAHLYSSPPPSPEKPLSTSQHALQTFPRDSTQPEDQGLDAKLPSTPRRSERIRTRSIALPPLTPASPQDAQSPAKRRRSL